MCVLLCGPGKKKKWLRIIPRLCHFQSPSVAPRFSSLLQRLHCETSAMTLSPFSSHLPNTSDPNLEVEKVLQRSRQK